MEKKQYHALSKEAWDAELEEARKQRRFTPNNLTDEQARDLFSKIGPMALKTIARKYGNHVRKMDGRGPLPLLRLPQSIEDWIAKQVRSVDDLSGNVGSQTFGMIANAMLEKLRDVENHFRNQ